MSRSAFGSDANRLGRPTDVLNELVQDPVFECQWRGCPLPQWAGTPVCFVHALVVSQRLETCAPPQGPDEPAPPPNFQSFVYYLMLGPSTVKIGTTQWLQDRIRQLRTEMQYIVALELGDRLVERERHLQFADERRNRREDFHLSDRLKAHIEALQPNRDELLALAVAREPLT